MYFTPNLVLSVLAVFAFDSAVLSAPVNGTAPYSESALYPIQQPTQAAGAGASSGNSIYPGQGSGAGAGAKGAGAGGATQAWRREVQVATPAAPSSAAPSSTRSIVTKSPQYPTTSATAQVPPTGVAAVQYLI
ncbi:hypothetical protein ZYGR_0N07240 [Zygosaccharomyces rouxii]|uniref:ZYRO0D16918p n=2 Tax=Zygosaccharomyces rouxii TaxID=4956 RepID=C5DWR2_ZYGRC|nr:uncharacterized protein ZYRO0D16918g [Zygosaccharomyces rouxii]KAH9201141.1 hypothetical protein LQ764DRAFT_209489 [Zygosaccharomyces rouxii]GAV49317.1 hypothetical protein ZYGR_0N07240 [Zygosaccharomyces rouxii]CAR28231.1 ZYRO0D16918p [Zygosaccharomyces rouxii]